MNSLSEFRHAGAKRRKSTGDLPQRVTQVPGSKVRSKSQSVGDGRGPGAVPGSLSSGFFSGVCAYFVEGGTSSKRLKIWKDKVVLLGGSVAETLAEQATEVTHVLATDFSFVKKDFPAGLDNLCFVRYSWIEDCLKEGRLVSCERYILSKSVEPEAPSPSVGVAPGRAQEDAKSVRSFQRTEDVVCQGGQTTPAEVKDVGEIGIGPRVQLEADGAANALPGSLLSSGDKQEFGHGKNVDNLDSEDDEDADFENLQGGLGEGEKYEQSTLNAHITKPLRDMWHIYEDAFGDEWRALTYKKAGNQIDRLPYKLTNAQQLKSVNGLGSSILAKVKEIITTGRLQKLDNLQANEQVQTICLFSSVWGIGPKLARKLYQAGHRTLDDIANDPSLTHMSKLGLRFHDDLNLRIPREEVHEAEKFVVLVAEGLCAGVWARATGSYRRGQATCGDIDILITHPDGQSQEGLLAKLVDKLTLVGFLAASLDFTDHSMEGTKHQVDSFMGICKVSGFPTHRRIDIKVYPKHMYAFALLAFTGNDVLNRRLRYAATTKGYKLNDSGLFLRPSKQRSGASTNVSVPCLTEQEVFENLGFPYPEPHDRNW